MFSNNYRPIFSACHLLVPRSCFISESLPRCVRMLEPNFVIMFLSFDMISREITLHYIDCYTTTCHLFSNVNGRRAYDGCTCHVQGGRGGSPGCVSVLHFYCSHWHKRINHNPKYNPHQYAHEF